MGGLFIIIPNGVRVDTHSDPVFLVELKLSLLPMCVTSERCISAFAAAGCFSASRQHGGKGTKIGPY